MKKLVLALLIVFLLMLIQGLFPNYSVAFSTITITSGERSNYPQIQNNRIVYQRFKNPNEPIDPDIYIFDLNNKTARSIASNGYGQYYPSIYGDYVVWQDNRNSTPRDYNPDIYLYNIATNTEKQISTNMSGQTNPKIFNNFIVWQDNRDIGKSHIFMFDLSTNTEASVVSGPNSQYNPDIYGQYIVWDEWNEISRDIYIKNISNNSITAITTADGNQTNPAIYGNRVVWEDDRDGFPAIYMKDIADSQETRVSTNSNNAFNPDIFGDLIVWEDYRYSDAEIFVKDLRSGIETRISSEPSADVFPAINEDKIVWFSNPASIVSNVYMADIAAPVTSVDTNPVMPDGNNGYYKNPPTLWISKNEPGVSYYLWNSLSFPWQTFINPLVPTRGTNNLFYYSIDVAGNVEGINSKAVNVEQLNIAISPAPVNPTPPKKKVRVATNFHKKKCKNKKFHAKHCKVSAKLKKKKNYKKLVKVAKQRHKKKCTKIILK